MRAWRVHELGEPGDVLTLEDDVAEPAPGPGEVAVRVATAGINFPDSLLCRGAYQVRPPLPFIPGLEVCGGVIAVGAGSRHEIGSRVVAMPEPPYGGYADVCIAKDHSTMAIPDTFGDSAQIWPAAESHKPLPTIYS